MGKKFTGEPLTATEKLQRDVSKTTDAAVKQGEKDVEQAKAVGAGYVEQVKALAQNGVDTTKVMVPQRQRAGNGN